VIGIIIVLGQIGFLLKGPKGYEAIGSITIAACVLFIYWNFKSLRRWDGL